MTTAALRHKSNPGTVVDMADLKICEDPSGMLVTYSLGSCVAVCLYDPIQHVIGMIHYMLPLSQTSPDKAAAMPAMFADTGVPLLFQGMFELGCCKEALVVKVVGGGNLHDTEGIFNIGERNVTFIRKLMRKNGIPIAAEDVGGQKSRTVRLYAAGGRVTVSSLELEMEL